MWGVTPSDRWDWNALRVMISKHGVRNSLLIAPMPTASTSQILGNNECFEPFTSNIYSHKVLRYVFLFHNLVLMTHKTHALSTNCDQGFIFSEEFSVVNKHLVHDLTEMGLWSSTLKNQIMCADGSIQKVIEIPEDLKAIYKYDLIVSGFY